MSQGEFVEKKNRVEFALDLSYMRRSGELLDVDSQSKLPTIHQKIKKKSFLKNLRMRVSY